VHWQGACWHFGHLCGYLLSVADSRSMPIMLARDASHAMTSANSFSVASLSVPSSASPSSLTSSTSQSYVPFIPRSESL
jgi:hypothetical protein